MHHALMDVRRCFDSIDHAALLRLLVRVFKDHAVLRPFGGIVASHSTAPGRGLPIGNLTPQHFANRYLGELDRREAHFPSLPQWPPVVLAPCSDPDLLNHGQSRP